MRVVVQRVSSARVDVAGESVGEIGAGYLLLVGVARGDGAEDVAWAARKIANMRVFADDEGKMNRNLAAAGGSILSVSQFTLCADMKSGNRPGFDGAAPPEGAKALWNDLNEALRRDGFTVAEGRFGADMKVALVNEGPVTVWLDSRT